jgi:hypothetical protein
MTDREVVSAGWTDDLFRLLLDVHKRLKLMSDTSAACEIPQNFEITLLGLEEELVARSQAMAELRSAKVDPNGSVPVHDRNRKTVRALVSKNTECCISQIEEVLAANTHSNLRIAVSKLAVVYARLVLAIGKEHHIEEDYMLASSDADNGECEADFSEVDEGDEVLRRVKQLSGERWETQYRGPGNVDALKDEWAGGLLVGLRRTMSQDEYSKGSGQGRVCRKSSSETFLTAVRNGLKAIGITSVSQSSLCSAEYEILWRERLLQVYESGLLASAFDLESTYSVTTAD